MARFDSSSPAPSQPALYAENDALADLRLSIDSEQNGHGTNGANHLRNGSNKPDDSERRSGELSESERYERVKSELERTQEEKETLATQYRNLLTKLNTMRTGLAKKLQQDAEELDRREQLVQQLTAEKEDMSSTIQTLETEIIASNAEAERASKELEVMRNRALDEGAQESLMRERELRETQAELERCRMERDEWEQAAMEERVGLDEAKATIDSLRRELDMEREARARDSRELEYQRVNTSNLQSVLEDFQIAKDRELRQAVETRDAQLEQVTQSLAEYKHRAHNAESELEELSNNTSRSHDLEKEVKEKTLLINKLRHEAVIMNEHLMEALRRLRKNSQDNNVDRRLVTNVLLSFLTTPRADSKRFEMLGLLATVLSWSDAEREKAGLQRTGPTSSSLWGRSSTTDRKGKSPDIEKTDETESFSQMWVEFLLKEAAGTPSEGSTSPSRSNTSLPGTPTSSSPGALRTARLPSFTSVAMSSSPNLTLPPSRKGKERTLS